jgi:hypothetical protein
MRMSPGCMVRGCRAVPAAVALVAALLSQVAAAPVAMDTLAGALPKVLKNPGHPYLVVADIEVPQDRMVVVEEGAVLLFRPFTGLHVQGRLEVHGTKLNPVVFTSENDPTHSGNDALVANPFDWNGIYVHGAALGSSFENIRVQYSVYGIVSETRFVRVDPGVFVENGKSNLVIEGVEKVSSAEPHSYVLSTKDAMVDGVPVKILKDPAAPRRNAYRYVGLGLLLVGCGAGAAEAVLAGRASDELDALSNTNAATVEGFDNLRYGSSAEWDNASSSKTWNTVGCVAGFVVGALGAAGLVWSFTF